jgi:hypothetical protein
LRCGGYGREGRGYGVGGSRLEGGRARAKLSPKIKNEEAEAHARKIIIMMMITIKI